LKNVHVDDVLTSRRTSDATTSDNSSKKIQHCSKILKSEQKCLKPISCEKEQAT